MLCFLYFATAIKISESSLLNVFIYERSFTQAYWETILPYVLACISVY